MLDYFLFRMFVLACMPPPTAIPVVLTYAAYGNHALAIINTIMATVLSCITCPTLLFLMVLIYYIYILFFNHLNNH